MPQGLHKQVASFSSGHLALCCLLQNSDIERYYNGLCILICKIPRYPNFFDTGKKRKTEEKKNNKCYHANSKTEIS